MALGLPLKEAEHSYSERRAMAIHGNLRDFRFTSDVDDIRGSEIYGLNDDKLGTVDDIIFDIDSGDLRYLVVDTGGWLSANRFLVPAREVMNTVEGDDHFRVNLTREQIERLPAFDEQVLSSDDEFKDYEQRYHSAGDWTDATVLHREGSTHMITPTAEEMPAGSGDAPQVSAQRPFAMDNPRFGAASYNESSDGAAQLGVGPRTTRTQTDDATRRNASDDYPDVHVTRRDTEANRRFREFQDRLRQERENVLRKLQERDRDRAA
jgi:sporulation protein YlmC with PRC-barrel domain